MVRREEETAELPLDPRATPAAQQLLLRNGWLNSALGILGVIHCTK